MKFDEEKAVSQKKEIWAYNLINPLTTKLAKFLHSLGISANQLTFIIFLIGMSAVAVLLFVRSYIGLIIVAVLIILRNIGDFTDGKIARGSDTTSSVGGFSDIIADWLFFQPAFFIALGYVTGHLFIGVLCVTGYMSREFMRRMFEKYSGIKAIQTKEAEKMSLIVSIVKKYELASVFCLIPIVLLINPVLIIYGVAIIEYTLLFGELGFDLICFRRKNEKDFRVY